MISYINGEKILTDFDLPLFSIDEVSNTSKWSNGGAGLTNGKLDLYDYQDNRISAFFPIKQNHQYNISIANMTNRNFYFNVFLTKSQEEGASAIGANNHSSWIKDTKAISVNSDNWNYFCIILGSDDGAFTNQAINSLVKITVNYKATLQDLANEIAISKNQNGGGKA